jgi:uncharacterized protein (TIGR02453 family)
MEFDGFGKDAQDFYRDLADNNTKQWFEEHRDRYEQAVREPAERFVMSLGERLKEAYPGLQYDTRRNGAGSLMRINRDVRFSPDKRPYKTNLGVVFWIGEGKKTEVPGFYFHIGLDQIFFYGGQHIFPKDILERYRAAAADEKMGGRLRKILDALAAQGLPCFEEPAFKRVPRPYPIDHPRADLLRFAGMGVARLISAEAIRKADAVEACSGDAISMKPLIQWLMELNGAGLHG